jgi:methyl-accepting chemotaxis protein
VRGATMKQWSGKPKNTLALKGSIRKKILTAFIASFVIFSIIFSLTLYNIAMGIVNDHVLRLFTDELKTNIQQLTDHTDKDLVLQSDQGSADAYNKLLTLLNQEKKRMNVENTYVLAKKDGKSYIVALSDAADQRNKDYAFTSEMSKAVHGSMQMSDIYKDEYGVHKSIFVPIDGTDMILGIDMDAKFIGALKSKIVTWCLAITLALIVVGSLAGFVLARRITRPLMQLLHHTQNVASGDLMHEIRIQSQDEIGKLAESFNQMTSQLKEMIKGVMATSEQVALASKDVSESTESVTVMVTQTTQSIQEITDGSEKLASNAMESSKAMEEIAVGIQHIVESTMTVSEESQHASQEVMLGNESIQSAVSQMNFIDQSMEKSNELVLTLSNRTNEISKVVDLIKNIAGQINLLALNAAIEAARAGEYGRGFSVVADEIRKLAEQSAQSTTEITDLIQSIHEDSVRSVEAMEKVQKEVHDGNQSVQNAGQSFTKILTLVNDVAHKVQDVSAVMQQISASSQQVSASVEEVAQVTQLALNHTKKIAETSQEQLAVMEETSACASTMSNHAFELKGLVENFKV